MMARGTAVPHLPDPAPCRYYLRGACLFASRRGDEKRILSFCLDHPEQADVVELPIVGVGRMP